MPVVSVIIPTYNRAAFLETAIISALDQSFGDIEVIVVDDGSTDTTREVVQRISDPRLRYVYQENQGAAAALNAGVDRSAGEYVGKMDSDDWYLPGALERLVDAIHEQPDLGVAAGGYVTVDVSGKVIDEVQPWLLHPSLGIETWLMACPVLWQGALIRRGWMERVGGFDTAIRGPEDWDYGIRLAHAGCGMSWLRRPVFCYRIHDDDAMDMKDTSRVRREVLYILDKFFGRSDLPSEIENRRDQVYATAHLNMAGREYAARQFEAARDDVERAVELDPGLLDAGGGRLLHAIAWWARGARKAGPPIAFVTEVVDHLPTSVLVLGPRLPQRARAEWARTRLFQAYGDQDWATVRRSLVDLARYDPVRIVDRGVASAGVQSVVGTAVAGFVRRLVGREPGSWEEPT